MSDTSRLADAVWDGVTRASSLTAEAVRLRTELADAARAADWPRVYDLVSQNPQSINSSRLEGTSLFAPLHQAAYAGAPIKVVERLIEMGAWRTLQNARGERPLDVAERRQHNALRDVLEPRLRRRVPGGVILKIQSQFHDVIRSRAANLVAEHALRLPELEPLLELEHPSIWFPVPGMYGGFRYRLERDGVDALLVTESWCRIAGGSGQRHEITSQGSRLVEQGFV
jgi:hypothetical protein